MQLLQRLSPSLLRPRSTSGFSTSLRYHPPLLHSAYHLHLPLPLRHPVQSTQNSVEHTTSHKSARCSPTQCKYPHLLQPLRRNQQLPTRAPVGLAKSRPSLASPHHPCTCNSQLPYHQLFVHQVGGRAHWALLAHWAYLHHWAHQAPWAKLAHSAHLAQRGHRARLRPSSARWVRQFNPTALSQPTFQGMFWGRWGLLARWPHWGLAQTLSLKVLQHSCLHFQLFSRTTHISWVRQLLLRDQMRDSRNQLSSKLRRHHPQHHPHRGRDCKLMKLGTPWNMHEFTCCCAAQLSCNLLEQAMEIS